VSARFPALVLSGVLVATSACSGGADEASPQGRASSTGTPTAAAPYSAFSEWPTTAAATPPSRSRHGGAGHGDRDGDVTQDAAAQYRPPSGQTPGAAAVAGRPAVDYADPLAVAAGYLAARLTYRYDDPDGYRAAMTAPVFTTPAFAARSRPPAAALTRLATAQETSQVRVAGARLEGEAPHTPTTRYVHVTGAITVTYRGHGTGRAEPVEWTLRLVQTPGKQWRVDGVLSAT
jgi:hypothetical protein